MRTHGVNQTFRFVEGIWLHRKSHQIGYFYPQGPIFLHACATWNEQPSNLKTKGNSNIGSHVQGYRLFYQLKYNAPSYNMWTPIRDNSQNKTKKLIKYFHLPLREKSMVYGTEIGPQINWVFWWWPPLWSALSSDLYIIYFAINIISFNIYFS